LSKFISINEIIATNRKNFKPTDKIFTSVLISNVFTPPLNDFIDYHLRTLGINSLSKVIDLSSLEVQRNVLNNADIIYVDYDPFSQLNYSPSSFLNREIIDNSLIQKTQMDLSRIMTIIPKKVPVIFKLFSSMHVTKKFKQLTLLDKSAIWLNNWLIHTYPEMHFFDPVKVITKESAPTFPRLEDVKRNFSFSYIFESSELIAELISKIFIPDKKVLLLDCDNTLWNGLIGEQDIEDLTFFLEIHKIVKMLKECGVIICFVTKNDEANIEKFFNRSSIVKKDDIYKVFAGWEPKSKSVEKIAYELNLHYDSMVFVDDNINEINEVKNLAPTISTLLVNPIYDTYLKEFAALITLFIKGDITNEDRIRVLDYQSRSKRVADKSLYVSEADYLKSLNMQVIIKSNQEVDFARVAQLLTRTNQFNLTQIRLSADQLQEFVDTENSIALTFELNDKYSTLGVICACLLIRQKEVLKVHNISLSCRAFGRKLEDFVMSEVHKLAEKHGCKKIDGSYVLSEKNHYCRSYFLDNGFDLVYESPQISNFSLKTNKFKKNSKIENLFEVKREYA
jgi:FkbH-like protein